MTLTATVLASALLSATLFGIAGEERPRTQQDSGAAVTRADLVAQLLEHLTSAAQRATLTGEQRQRVQNARENLARAELVLRKSGVLNPIRMLKMRGTIGDIERLAKSNAFSASDRETILQDIEVLKRFRHSRGPKM